MLESNLEIQHCSKLRSDGFDVDGAYAIEIDGKNVQVYCEFLQNGENWLVRNLLI